MVRLFIKYAPVLVTIVMGMAFYFALNGQYWCLEYLSGKFGCALFILPPYMWITSDRWHFCHWHKVFIINIALVSLAANIKIDFHLNEYYTWYFRITLFITTVSLLVSAFLYFKYGCYKNRLLPK